METEINNLKVDMAELKTDVRYIKESIQELNDKLSSFIICADNKYATKESQWSEKFLAWAGGIIGTVVIIGVLTLIAAGYLHLNS